MFYTFHLDFLHENKSIDCLFFRGLCPHPASGIRLGFLGNTINADGIRYLSGWPVFGYSRPGFFFYKCCVSRSPYNTISWFNT